MRMWMVDPRIMCRKHLLGAHNELHKHRHVFVKGHSITGRRGQIEPQAMRARHDNLADEMLRRGYNHHSPYEQPDLDHYDAIDANGKVDRNASLRLLLDRCPDCRARASNESKQGKQ